jgi:hypothetical protein
LIPHDGEVAAQLASATDVYRATLARIGERLDGQVCRTLLAPDGSRPAACVTPSLDATELA